MFTRRAWAPASILIMLLTVILTGVATPALYGRGFDRLSPFSMVRWQGERPEVQVKNTWYQLLAIDGIKTTKILAFCKTTYGDRWDKRFCEDLVEVLNGMRHPPGPTVTLEVAELKGGRRHVLEKVPMTADNRERIRDARPRAGQRTPRADLERVDRKHKTKPVRSFRFLTPRYWEAQQGLATLDARRAAEDLDQLEWHIQHEFAYRDRLGFDYRGALDTIRLALDEEITVRDFHIQLRKLLALFGDGHSRVRGVQRALRPGLAPFPIADLRGRLVALAADGDELLDDAHPFIGAIDNVPIAKWVEAARRYVAAGSPQLVRLEMLSFLDRIGHLRRDLALTDGPTLRVLLESADRRTSAMHELELAHRPRRYRPRFREGHAVLDGNIGYLRVASMALTSGQVQDILSGLADLADTDGLVIDVRDNGGGSRELLRELYPCLMADGEKPRVVNVAAYRLPPGIQRGARKGYLWNRALYPAAYPHWKRAERDAVAGIAHYFHPKWRPKKRDFSAWHFMVVGDAAPPVRYTKTVVILMDGGCFSATDIFLGAFQDHPRAILVGTPSAGGSGRSRPIMLGHSGLKVNLSTMASFQPNGSLYDGRGITPDVVVERTLDDLLGRTDTQLDAATEYLFKNKKGTR